MFLLDTNVCTGILNNRAAEIERQFRAYGPQRIAVCSVVKAELYAGARRSGQFDRNLQRLKRFFAPLRSMPFDDLSAEYYGQIYADLSSRGMLIGPNDQKVAAIARARDCELVTHNTREFGRVVGLRI